eukprot:CAMPEP_0180324762 /NCGR_PEP_ID=MMETSP0988-20121125/38031_1 /TAXON_ID=697907 /ORGANISM="non described non described, Strain CCMP2293" /LENGTH=220 /DNA_ID=CAMNT_0022311081 /DNA_START=102 /DNA_END=761 /DNA_ORIENTATION=-
MSRNPLYVNGERVVTTAKLESGDCVKLPGMDEASSIEFRVAIPLYRLRVRSPAGVEDYRVVFDAEYEIGRKTLGESGVRERYAIDVGQQASPISRRHCLLQHDAGSGSTWVKCLSKVNYVRLDDGRAVRCNDVQQLNDAALRIFSLVGSTDFYEFTKLALGKPEFEAQVEVMQAEQGPGGEYGETQAMDGDEDFGPSSVDDPRGEGSEEDGASADDASSG